MLCASRELFQRRLTDLVKQSGIDDAAALAAFSDAIGEAHDRLAAAPGARADAQQTSDLTASRLTLMGDEDLELDIRIRGIGSRLRDAGGRNLWRSQLRYMTLLSRPTMSAASNPVGAEAICPGLWAISKLGVRIEQTLALLERIESDMTAQLPGVYAEIDRLLAAYGIAAAQGQYAPVGSDVRLDSQQSSPSSRPPASALASLQQAIGQRVDADQPGTPVDFAADSSARAGNVALDAAAMVMLNHLFDRLTALEDRSASAADDGAAAKARARAPLGGLKARDLDLPLGKKEAVTLDTMAVIFDAIFDSAELPDAIKAAIGRLQIPLLKLSILDPSLFANDQHPARLLINRMARAAVGLSQHTGSEYAICQQIGRLTVAVRATLEQSGASLTPHLVELDALISERDEGIRLANERQVQLVLEYENRQFATQLADNWLRLSLAKNPSDEVAAFLENHWLRVMVAAASDGGSEGKRWQQHSATADEIIWSVLPKQTADERKRLAGMASSLLGRISSGLDEIGVSADERKAFLNTLFALQTRALRSQVQAAPAQARAVSDRSRASGPCILEDDGRQVRYLKMPAGVRSSPAAPAGDWQVGDWLRFSVADQQSMCGLCCWQNPTSGTVLLANPDWGYAVAMPRVALDQQIRSGRARVASRVAIFDAAAERALTVLERR